MATLLAWKAPGRPQGPLLAAAAVATIVTELPDNGALSGSWMLLYLPYALIVLVMPDGWFGSAGWRRLAFAVVAVPAVFNLLIATSWYVGVNPDDHTVTGAARDVAGVLQVIGVVLVLGFFALLIAAVSSLIPRYRRSDERQRLQLRWMLLAGSSLPLTLLLCWIGYLLSGQPDLVVFGLLVMYVVIPAAVTVALLRPTWFDIDRATVATATTTALTGLMLILIAIASAAGPHILTDSPAVTIVATAVLMLLMIPLYRLLGPAIGRVVYPERERAIRALRLLRCQVDAGTAEPELIETVLRQALRDPGLRVVLHRLSDAHPVTVQGDEVDHELAIDADLDRRAVVVRSRGEEIGAIIGSRQRVKPPARAVAVAAAPVLEAVRLRTELTQALGEIAASRQRILIAGDEERRRLERDLHDGAQQRLVALGMRLRVLQRSGIADADVEVALDQTVAELATAVAELRQLAHGVRPSALDDGLEAALAELARQAPQLVSVEATAGELPDAVCTTAYYVAAEAVANALKHAGATTIRIFANRTENALLVSVSDDGRGGADPAIGVGLAGIRERVLAIGGRFGIRSPIGGGTTISITLPSAPKPVRDRPADTRDRSGRRPGVRAEA
ncbi:hypothetical protein FOE78_22930 [Microlunatus elymi]|uniref:histidine kinase n=1 Tax=Microlunatus elymi TaxID=2596828 RepID=A0A516Q4K9_9ACTN|nr:hypothetical protein FOE78_22930 [Microlunatus elymi]